MLFLIYLMPINLLNLKNIIYNSLYRNTVITIFKLK
nr:MAG TPA: hypothetical protein [Caudoviricetes sp.]